MARNAKEEQDKVQEDDVLMILMWRGLMLYIAHEEMRKALRRGEEEASYQLSEQTFLQSQWGGKAKKQPLS